MTDPVFDHLDGRCQFCGWPCDAEFCSDAHWQMWVLTGAAQAAFTEFAARMREVALAMQPALAQIAETMRSLHTSLVEAGLVPEEPPSDPKARALHVRQHRNTGPAVHADPRRNRRVRR